MLRVQPLWARVSAGGWWLLSGAVALALVIPMSAMAGADLPAAWPGLGPWLSGALLELAVGTVWGLLVALPTYALLGSATEIRDAFVGPSGSEALVLMVVALGLALGLGLGVHRPLLLALLHSAELMPIGAPLSAEIGPDLLSLCVLAARDALTLALALVTPLLLSLAITDTLVFSITSAFAPRAAPSKVALSWFRVFVALLALGASWSTFPEIWARALA